MVHHILNLWSYLKNIIALGAEYHDALIEMMVLHGTGRIQNGQWAGCFRLERIVCTAMVQVVAQASNK